MVKENFHIVEENSHKDLLCIVKADGPSTFYVYSDGSFISNYWEKGELAMYEIRPNQTDQTLEFWYKHVGKWLINEKEDNPKRNWTCDREGFDPNSPEDDRLIKAILEELAIRKMLTE